MHRTVDIDIINMNAIASWDTRTRRYGLLESLSVNLRKTEEAAPTQLRACSLAQLGDIDTAFCDGISIQHHKTPHERGSIEWL